MSQFVRPAVIGGEQSSRGFFGGRMTRARKVALFVGAGAIVVLSILLKGPGALVGVLILVLGWVVTIDTDNDTVWSRRISQRRWRLSKKDGTWLFVPFNQQVWDTLWRTYERAKSRSERGRIMDDIRAMRDTPNGVQGFRWLEQRLGEPGIGWHRPPNGEEEYFSVAYAHDGQVSGIEPDVFLANMQANYERVLAAHAPASSRLRRVQPITRVLPVDSVRHEKWLFDNLDPKAPHLLKESYAQVIALLSAGQLSQRHFTVGVWPVTPQLREDAADRGEGVEGLRQLMAGEIQAFAAELQRAGFRGARPLTARQTAAVIRHMQNPDFAIDRVNDITPDAGWLPSKDSRSYTTYYGAPYGPDGGVTGWKTMTARFAGADVEPAERDSLWLTPVLSGMSTQIVRTISFHLELVPQAEARALAREDLTDDLSEKQSDAQKGRLEDETTDMTAKGAARRRADLSPGRTHHGVNWVGYVTVAARTRKDLRRARRSMEDAASNAGIHRLTWVDAQSSTVNCYAWPLGRGITPRRKGLGDRFMTMLTGSKSKEAL
ncbi:hypothetical protein [Agromyces sp. Soil535]|uniref:hypothetical protein n=1 Tax=Agromyces sp. Soil535 TaxID=1736390 RepID=UPI0006F3D435|nr:hypothetical protein [Agromyces sp. Soil535]KRE28251.1 hypothetical protein ASG80_21470 [Agromyces sp. Soil535]